MTELTLTNVAIEDKDESRSDLSSTCTLSDSGDVVSLGYPAPQNHSSDVDVQELVSDMDEYTPMLPIWLSSDFYLARLKPLMDFSGPGNTFSLTTIPSGAAWGDGHLNTYLCYRNRPISIFVVGELQALGCAVDRSSEACSTRVRVDVMRDVDRQQYATQLQRSRGLSVDVPYMFEAVRVHRGKTKISCKIIDATASEPPAGEAPLLPLTDVAVGDVVVLETALIRERRRTTATYSQWDSYACKFVLCNLAVLARSPDRQ